MASENPLGTSAMTFTAGGTIDQYRLVKGDSTTARQVVVSAAEGDATVGVSLESASTGGTVPVATVAGTIVKVTAGAAFSAWAQLEATSSGKAITAGGAAARTVAIAIEEAFTDGDIVSAILLPIGNGPANS
jgi:hypothetical protein